MAASVDFETAMLRRDATKPLERKRRQTAVPAMHWLLMRNVDAVPREQRLRAPRDEDTSESILSGGILCRVKRQRTAIGKDVSQDPGPSDFCTDGARPLSVAVVNGGTGKINTLKVRVFLDLQLAQASQMEDMLAGESYEHIRL